MKIFHNRSLRRYTYSAHMLKQIKIFSFSTKIFFLCYLEYILVHGLVFGKILLFTFSLTCL